MVFVAALLLVVYLMAAVHFSQTARVAWFAGLVLAVLLYEAVAVSVWGCTLGQWLSNLRVVAPTPSGRLPFWKAFLRWLLKGATGLASFATMGATQRNQALHDLPFGTTVEIADPRRALGHHFIRERPALAPAGTPSRIRRLLVIAGYLVLIFLLWMVLINVVVSQDCIDTNACKAGENQLLGTIGTGWLAASIAAAVFGWQGRLPGARRRRQVSVDQARTPDSVA
jgi:hypothetical protein